MLSRKVGVLNPQATRQIRRARSSLIFPYPPSLPSLFPPSRHFRCFLFAGSRFINADGVGLEEVPTNNSLASLLNRSSLMDVPFRGLQRQHSLVYLASLNDPSASANQLTESSMQAYGGFDMDEAGYLEYGLRVVS